MSQELPNRKPLRLRNFDYSTPGAYFITFCTHNRRNLLSRIVGAIHESPENQLTEYGRIADRIIRTTPPHLNAAIDRYVIMPNHIHLIIIITNEDDLRSIRESPLRRRSVLSKTVGYIKMNISKEIHRRYGKTTVWQRGFHDHIIRSKSDYKRIAEYIDTNPLRWYFDCFYTV